MIVPLGWFVTGVLYCVTPVVVELHTKDWYEKEKDARFNAKILDDAKWFMIQNRKCIYKDVKVIKE